ncbi:MAG: DEAD/DEAH box helicase [Candidatus Thermoplasmatota archaeon]
MNTTFDKLGLKAHSLAAVKARGFDTPTPIQALSIPILLQGEDLIGQAQTGTGKTLAFGLPIIEDTKLGRGPPQTLVLAPTRELANQIVEELNKMAAGTPFKAAAVYGGVGFGNQLAMLRRGNVTCIVACPGRLLDLLQRREADVSMVKHVVLDEADRMLDMGFIRDIDKIFGFLPKRRQTMLFSATIPPEIKRLAERYLREPQAVRAETGPTATELTEQFEVIVRGDKITQLVGLLEKEKPERSLIFTRTKHGAKRLAKRLNALGFRSDALQGNLSQNARDRVMADFRQGAFDHLVATDVAARGLDVKEITHVINFDFPMVNEDYVHRIGRTGRAGKTGRSFLFVEHGEEKDARAVERISGIRMERYDIGPVRALPPPDPAHVDRGAPPRGAYSNGGGHHRPGSSSRPSAVHQRPGGQQRGYGGRGPQRSQSYSGGGRRY